jgi:hypothetical protein
MVKGLTLFSAGPGRLTTGLEYGNCRVPPRRDLVRLTGLGLIVSGLLLTAAHGAAEPADQASGCAEWHRTDPTPTQHGIWLGSRLNKVPFRIRKLKDATTPRIFDRLPVSEYLTQEIFGGSRIETITCVGDSDLVVGISGGDATVATVDRARWQEAQRAELLRETLGLVREEISSQKVQLWVVQHRVKTHSSGLVDYQILGRSCLFAPSAPERCGITAWTVSLIRTKVVLD